MKIKDAQPLIKEFLGNLPRGQTGTQPLPELQNKLKIQG